MDGIAERLINVAGGARVEADHLANGHIFSSIIFKPVDSLARSA
jgi:hypothetical protein